MVGGPGDAKTAADFSWLPTSYGLEAQSCEKRDGVWRVECGRGAFAVREYNGDDGRLEPALDWQNFLAAQGCRGVPSVIKTKGGQNWTKYEGKTYYVTAWAVQQEFNPQTGEHLLAAVEQLGVIHRLSRDYSRDRQGRLDRWHADKLIWPVAMQKRLSEILGFDRCIRSRRLRTDFERVFAENCRPFYRQGQEALQELVVGGFAAELPENGHPLVNSFLKRNMGVNKEVAVYVDLTRWALGPPAMDLALFLNSFLPLHKWDCSLVGSLLETYEQNNALPVRERSLLVPLLRFPWRFWLYARQYADRTENPAALTAKLASYIDETRWREKCLESLDGWVWREKR